MPPFAALSVKIELPVPPEDKTTLLELSEAVNPVVGVTVNETVPVNPPWLARFRVEDPDEPAKKLTVVGLALRPKSGTLIVTVTV